MLGKEKNYVKNNNFFHDLFYYRKCKRKLNIIIILKKIVYFKII